MSGKTNVREIAFDGLLAMEKGNNSNTFIADILEKYSYLDKQDRSFLGRLLEGTIERMITIDYVLDSFSKVKVKKMKPPVRALTRLGVYQILYMDSVPDSAAVNETVKIAKKRGLSGLTGFINGLLRSISRDKNKIAYPGEENSFVKCMSIKYSCPEWIVEFLTEEQGKDGARAVLDNSVSVRPITARVNITRTNTAEIIAKEPDKISQNELLDFAIDLHNIDKVTELYGFLEGKYVIQDISSMLVCHIADIKADSTIIDVCAAPGGKSLHAADIAQKGHVISCDVSYDKLQKISENVTRCGFSNVEMVCADGTIFREDFANKADIVLADVPCSGLGVMGRKNDIKYRLSKEQLDELVILQRKIIDNAVKYVKPGGILMYSTCTVHNGENIDNYRYICERYDFTPVDFSDRLPEKLQKDSAREGYIQLLGEDGLTDGFFISKFRRQS